MPLTERDVNIPPMTTTQTPPAQKTPRPLSKLPRRVPTPSTNPSTPQWASSVADRIASAEKAKSSITPRQKTPRTGTPATGKPLLQDKPLPSRPIARHSNMLSPSKDSRGLIDVCEKPLQITSMSGDKHGWPALKPQPSRSASSTPPTQSTEGEKSAETSASSTYATPSSIVAAAAELTNVITGKPLVAQRSSKRSSHSPTSSYASAAESSSPANISDESPVVAKQALDKVDDIGRRHSHISTESANTEFPARQQSLRNRISDGNFITPAHGSKHQFMGFTDFTRVETASPQSTESRPHSPSPASFSRLRPSSISSGSLNSRAVKTASRIPIPDSKKAMIVDLKKDLSPTPPMPKSTGLPTFGSRRLASPDALKILENGKMRRQMLRTPTNASFGPLKDGTLARNSDVTITKTPSLSTSLNSSNDDTAFAVNSPEYGTWESGSFNGDEAPTPSDRSLHFPKTSDHQYRRATNFSGQRHETEQDAFDDETASLKAPPQTSPFTAPLQTIPSETVLSVNAHDLNDETRDQLIRTLSHLEGKGSPPKFDVDNQTLLQMFGHLKRGLDRNSHHSAALMQNAAAAEKFLAQRGSSILEVKGLGMRHDAAFDTKTQGADVQGEGTSFAETYEEQQVDSKWSASTPSDNLLSPPSEHTSTGVQNTLTVKCLPTTSLTEDSSQEPASIGYPSRLPGRVTTTHIQPNGDSATIASIRSRRSSPTLSKRRPGSVRAAREGLQMATASFARTTASAESKKTTRMPTPNTRAFSIPEPSQRGRMLSVEKPRSRSEGLAVSKTPRSQSKSRYVLDKLNGLFSGKREKKNQAIPPVPRIEETSAGDRSVQAAAQGSPALVPPRPVQAPKMPSLSPSGQLAIRSASRATVKTDDTTLVDRISMKDETQCVQVLSEHLVGKARLENNPQRKERLLTFAKILNDSLISVREAAISAETAQHAAKSAQVSYELTQKSLAMVQRLAASVARSGSYNRR